MSSSAIQTIYLTVTSTVLYAPAADTPKASLVYQTQPLDLYVPVVPIKMRTRIPEATVASFDLHTPPADPVTSVLTESTPIKSDFGPTPAHASSLTDAPALSSALSSLAIAVIALGSVAAVGILIVLVVYLYRRRKASTHKDAEIAKPEDTLEEKMARARHLVQKRWSAHHIMVSKERFEKSKAKMAAKKDEAIVEEDGTAVVGEEEVKMPQVQYDRTRRPLGLMMHPPTPKSVKSKEDVGADVGRMR